jgi:hypothetical protein
MKKAFVLFAMIVALAGCNNGSNDGGEGDGGLGRGTDEDTTATDAHNVENVNGNLPDTTNSINLGDEGRGTGTGGDSTRR